MLSQIGGGSIASLGSGWNAYCIFISIIGRPTTFAAIADKWRWIPWWRAWQVLSPHGTGWNAYHYRLPSFLGGRLDTRRRLAVSSLLRTIRCQTSWISPATEYMLQYLLLCVWGRDSSPSSSPPERREVLLSRKTLWNDLLKYPTWNMLNVSTGAPENPLGILLTVHFDVSRGPQTLCPLCPWRAKQIPTRGVQQTFADGRTACSPFLCCWQQNLGAATSSTSGSNPWLHWAEVDLLPSLFFQLSETPERIRNPYVMYSHTCKWKLRSENCKTLFDYKHDKTYTKESIWPLLRHR